MSELTPYTEDLGKRICERLASGENLTNSCAEEHFTRQRFFRELIKNEKLADEYARAREARAHSQAEDDLAKGKRITHPKSYILGLARKIEKDSTQ